LGNPIRVNFDATRGIESAEAYHWLNKSTGKWLSDKDSLLNWQDFAKVYALYAFDSEPMFRDRGFQVKSRGGVTRWSHMVESCGEVTWWSHTVESHGRATWWSHVVSPVGVTCWCHMVSHGDVLLLLMMMLYIYSDTNTPINIYGHQIWENSVI
jgi:hypothetical protein